MADIKSVTPEEIAGLMEKGHAYVDVRSEPEFEQGHIPGAVNVPLLHRGAGVMLDNPDFMKVMQAAFPPDTPLILGCRAGPRSRKAAQLLAEAGFSNLSEMPAGWDGARDPFGRISAGYRRKGLPVETGQPAGRCYSDLKKSVS